jgi:hypothetical protein
VYYRERRECLSCSFKMSPEVYSHRRTHTHVLPQTYTLIPPDLVPFYSRLNPFKQHRHINVFLLFDHILATAYTCIHINTHTYTHREREMFLNYSPSSPQRPPLLSTTTPVTNLRLLFLMPPVPNDESL